MAKKKTTKKAPANKPKKKKPSKKKKMSKTKKSVIGAGAGALLAGPVGQWQAHTSGLGLTLSRTLRLRAWSRWRQTLSK